MKTLARRFTRDQLAHVPEYRMLEYMAMLGFSNKAIREILPLSNGQIGYRLKQANIKRKDYRDGINPVSRHIIGRLDDIAQRKVVQSVERLLLKGL